MNKRDLLIYPIGFIIGGIISLLWMDKETAFFLTFGMVWASFSIYVVEKFKEKIWIKR